MGEKIKVINCRETSITINLRKFNGTAKVVPASKDGNEGFTFLTEDELAYVQNTSTAFKVGILKLGKDQVEKLKDVEIPESPNALTEADIKEKLKKTAPKNMDKFLADITSLQTAKIILKVANEMDKPVSVIEAIEKKVEELIEKQ